MNLTPGSLTQLRQRILQRRLRRLSFKLEEIFWTQLEACAKEERVKLADLVFAVTGESGETENRSSLLRAYCVDWLRKRLLKARLAASQVDIQPILSACPAPCVIITRQRRLAAHNPAFTTEVLKHLVGPDAKQGENIIRLTLNKPFEVIVGSARASASGCADCHLTFTSATNQMAFIGHFCLFNRRSSEAEPLLCFLRDSKQLSGAER